MEALNTSKLTKVKVKYSPLNKEQVQMQNISHWYWLGILVYGLYQSLDLGFIRYEAPGIVMEKDDSLRFFVRQIQTQT